MTPGRAGCVMGERLTSFLEKRKPDYDRSRSEPSS